MFISEEDIVLIQKFANIKRRGYFANGKQVTELYNKVLNKNVKSTSCSSCIRSRIQELENALKQYEAEEAQKKAQEAADTNERGEKGETESVPLESIKKKRGRKPKAKEE